MTFYSTIIIYCITTLFCCTNLSAQNNLQPFFDRLNEKISQSAVFDSLKEKEIDSVKNADNTNIFDKYLKLYEAYKVYNYDSAYKYSSALLNAALEEKNDSLYEFAKLKQCFILVSSGMFKEAFDSLNTIHPAQLRPSFRAEYYIYVARCYYDLADYDNDRYHSVNYNKTGSRYVDSLLSFYPANSFEFVYYNRA